MKDLDEIARINETKRPSSATRTWYSPFCNRGHPDKSNVNDADPAENRGMQGRVRARHETLNGRLKDWGILSQRSSATTS